MHMNEFYKFAGEHPWLAFFIVLIAGEVIVRLFDSLCSIFR